MEADGSTSRSLLLRVRDNDQDAWRRLVNLYAPLVGHWFRVWGAAPDDVPDLMQEVFGAVARHLATYRPDQPGSTFRGWLRTIARNKFLDHVRTRSTPAEGGSEALVRLESVAGADEPPDSSDSDSEVAALYLRALEQVRATSRSGPGRPSGKSRWSGARRRRSPPSWASAPTPSARPGRGSSAASSRSWVS